MSGICATPGCGRKLPVRKGPGRPRKFCEVCGGRPSARAAANGKGKVKPTNPAPDRRGQAPDPDSSPLVDAYRAELERVERLSTPEGEHVMYLARLLAFGDHTAAGAAALSKELRTALEVAERGAPKKADALDELAARRERKASGA